MRENNPLEEGEKHYIIPKYLIDKDLRKDNIYNERARRMARIFGYDPVTGDELESFEEE